MNNDILPLETIVKNYSALIMDLWGVIHDGYAPYENSISFINKMRIEKKPVTFLSNTPRPGIISKNMLTDWGIDLDGIAICTSGDAVREQLEKRSDDVFSKLGKKFYHVGQARNKDLLSGGFDADLTDDLSEASFIIISAYLDEDEDIESFDYLFKEAISLNLPAICANPDLIVVHGPEMRYTAGTLAERYKKLGGTVYSYGKPNKKIYDTIINKYLDMNIPRSKILMVGDTLATDIKGAHNADIDSVLVLTGNGKEIHKKIIAGEKDIFSLDNKPTWISYGMIRI